MAVSRDEAKTWKHTKNLEADKKYGYSYPSVRFVKDLVLITYWVYDENTSRMPLKLKIISRGRLYGK